MEEGHWIKQVPTAYKAGLSVLMAVMLIFGVAGWTADFTDLPEQVAALELKDAAQDEESAQLRTEVSRMVTVMDGVGSKLETFICIHLAEDAGSSPEECLR